MAEMTRGTIAGASRRSRPGCLDEEKRDNKAANKHRDSERADEHSIENRRTNRFLPLSHAIWLCPCLTRVFEREIDVHLEQHGIVDKFLQHHGALRKGRLDHTVCAHRERPTERRSSGRVREKKKKETVQPATNLVPWPCGSWRPARTDSMKASSLISLIAACRGVSPGSILPPKPFHLPAPKPRFFMPSSRRE